MLNFKNIVTLYEEEDAANTANTDPNQQQTKPVSDEDAVVNFFLDKPAEIFKEFNGAFYQKYKVNISDEILRNLINAIRRSGYTNQYTVQDFIRYSDFFPFIDFLTFVIGLADKNQKPNVLEFAKEIKNDQQKLAFLNAADGYIEDFKKRAIDDSWPLDYAPKTAHAGVLQISLRQAASKNLIAEAAIEKILQDSLKVGIYKLLEIRKKIRDKQNKVPPSNQFIDSLLLTPEKHAGTTVTVPTQFKRLYPDTTVRSLVELGLLIKKFYEAEKQVAQELYNNQNETNIEIETTLQEFFENKLNNENKFEWRIPEQNVQQEQTAESKEKAFNSYYKSVLSKLEIINEQGNSVGYRQAYGDNYDSIFKSKNQETISNASNNNPLISPLENGYVIGNIKQLKGNDPAQKVYTKILALADYIREGEPFSILGALQDFKSASQGLAGLGGPNLDR